METKTRGAGRLPPMLRLTIPTLLAVLTISGCGPDHERLARLAERSVETQARQNEQMARQSEAVVQESQRLAQAAQHLVEKDAEARRELIVAQHQLNAELHAERSHLDRQRDAVEQDRRDLAKQRHRDPLIALTLHTIGMLIVCLIPLLVAAYALRQLHHNRTTDDELGDLLLEELTADRPRLLPPHSERPALPAPEPRSQADEEADCSEPS